MGSTYKILYIEDTLADFHLVERYLQKQGLAAECQRVANREELEAALRELHWDLVLSDYNVPALAFEETLKVLGPRLEELPLILISGSMGEERAVELLKQGVWDFVLKDNLTRLVPAIQRGLRDAADRRARRTAEAALRASEAALAEAQHIAKLGSWYFDLATGAVQWSEEIYHIFGIEKAATCSYEMFLNCVLPADRARVLQVNARARVNGESFQVDYRIQTSAGESKTIQEIGHATKDATGKVRGLFGIAQDITERKHAEGALRESEQKHRSLFEGSRDAILTLDPASGKFTACNSAAVKMFGARTEADLLAHGPADFSPARQPDGRLSSEVAREIDQSVVRVGSRFFEWSHRRLTGEEFFADVLLTRIEWDGRPTIMSTVRDISERKQAEAALRRSEDQFRTMFELASIGMVQTHPHTRRLVRVNQKMCEITGYSADELLQMNALDLTHLEDRELEQELFWRVLSGEMPEYHIEKRYVRKDGKIAWVNVNVTVIRDSNKHPNLILGTIEDITARRLAEEERRRLSTALEQAAESIVITDLAGMILYVNPAFERITGYSRQEAIGQNPRLLKSGRHDVAFYRQLWDTLTQGEVWHGHFVNKRKDGTLYEEDATISPVRDSAGKVVNYTAIKLDVTREVELERQFRQSQRLEAIGQLAGGVAHDFNNILTSILMQLELAGMETGLSSDLREGLRQINADANRAVSLTRQLLLFSRRQVMQSRDLDLNEIVTSLAKMLQRIIGEDVHLQLNLHSLPLQLHADPGMLDQVAMNLAVNARDAMPEGGRLLIGTSERIVDKVLAGEHPEAAPGRYACLSVTDTGCGISPEVLPKIFEPFFTTKEPGKGTGLGLATVFGIVKQHRGWLTVESAPRQGTTFNIFLPATTAAAPVAAETQPKSRGGTETILLAEDDQAVRKATTTTLERHGYRVLEAANGPEALALWNEHHDAIAMLFTDLVMPGGLSGRQLAQTLQAGKPGLKVIYASGYSAEIAGRELKLQAGENFLQKPYLPQDLLRTLRASLDV